MPAFLYFLPTDQRAASAALLKSVGLEYSLATNESVGSRFTTSGLDGKAGLVVAHDADGMDAAYQPEKQIWRKGKGGKFYVGRTKDVPIGPENLKRERLYEGTAVHLLDGNDWIVPRCFGMLEDRPTTLPHVLDLDDESDRLVAKIHPRFADLCKGAFDYWMEWTGQTENRSEYESLVKLAVDALAVNYRLSRIEAVGCLSLLGTDETRLILRAMIDADEIEAYAKAQASEKKST